MKINKKESDLLEKMVSYWQERGIISDSQSNDIKNSYEVAKFDWQSLAVYAFAFAVAFFVIALIAIVADKWLMQIVNGIMDAPNLLKGFFLAAIAFFSYYFAAKKKDRNQKSYSHEALLLCAIIATAGAAGYFGAAFNAQTRHYSLVILGATFVYGTLAWLYHSQLLMAVTLISAGVWFGTETAFLANRESYFLGMNYPLRFVLFGILTLALSFLINKTKISYFTNTTYTGGLLYVFGALWLLTIFGNTGSLSLWWESSQIQFLPWSILLFGACVAAIYIGKSKNSDITRETGIVFLIINIYTLYITFGWLYLHIAIFFGILALSFWFIGKKAEQIWTIGLK